MDKLEILHVSTVHQRYDTRVVYRECGGLAKRGHIITLLIADGQADQLKFDQFRIHSIVNKPPSRILRLSVVGFRMFLEAKKHHAKICHFHDPEWIFYAWLLSFTGKTIVYDIHEDYANVILNRDWIPKLAKKSLSYMYTKIERILCRRFSGIVTVTDTLIKKLENFKPVLVRNYPDLNIYPSPTQLVETSKYDAIYVGSISVERGADVMIEAANIVQNSIPDFKLHFVGEVESQELHSRISKSSAVTYHGKVNQEELTTMLASSKIGLAVLQPTPRYIVAFPTKIFEYMASGTFVIASDFPVYKEIIGDNSYCECVDPENPKQIAEAIRRGLSIKAPSARMESAKRVHELFSWHTELNKLEDLYMNISKHQSYHAK